jgi:hypothetical protein
MTNCIFHLAEKRVSRYPARVALRLLSLVAVALSVSQSLAEDFNDIGGEKYSGVKRTGTVVRVRSGTIEVNVGDKAPLAVLVSQDALDAAFAKHRDKTNRKIQLKCEVVGTADFSFVKREHGVSFSAELDKQRTAVEPVKELTVFTVEDPNKLWLIDTQPGLDEGKAASKAGYFQVNGQVAQLRKDGLTVKALAEQGKKTAPVTIKVQVSPDVKVNLKVAEYMLAKAGDAIEVDGFTFTKNKQEVKGTLLAEVVNIKLANHVGSDKAKPAVAQAERRADKQSTADGADKPTPPRAAAKKAVTAIADEPADAIVHESGDPAPGKLVFRDRLVVDEEDAPVGARAARRTPARQSPAAAKGGSDDQ